MNNPMDPGSDLYQQALEEAIARFEENTGYEYNEDNDWEDVIDILMQLLEKQQ